MENAILMLITALLSGLVATIVTIWWQKRHQLKAEKKQIFSVLMAKRYDFTAVESVEAMNKIDVIFYSSDAVRIAWKEFLEATNLPDSPIRAQTIKDKHLKMLELIADDIGYKKIKWENIKQYYYPIRLSTQLQDEAVLRKIQIDAGLAQISEAKKVANIPQDSSQ